MPARKRELIGTDTSNQRHPTLRILHPDEEIVIQAQAGETVVVVTDRRLAIGSQEALLLDIPIHDLRRIQFDIEKERPATLVLVPESPSKEPQVLVVQPQEYEEVGKALAVIGRRLAGMPA